jgi:CHAD domain-containing protein
MALTIETRKFAGQNAAKLLGRLAFQMNLAAKSPVADPVHDLRVSIRRFAQALDVFKSCFPGKDTRKIRRRLKKLMILAGAVRNCDIALKLLSKSRTEEAVNLRRKLQGDRKESGRVLIDALKRRMDRKSSLRWRTALESANASASDSACRIPIEDTARRILPRMAKNFLERGDAASQSKATPEKLHAFRIASKKFRYTLELFAPLYGTGLNSWLESIKRIQTLLGDINDCVTVAQMLSDYKSKGSIAGWLKRRQRKKVEEFTQCWQEEFGGREIVRTRMHTLSHPPGAPQATKKPATNSRASSKPQIRSAIA